MIEVFICDDDRTITDYLIQFIGKHYGEALRTLAFHKCMDLVDMFEYRDRVPEILIMDINLRDGNGIQVVKEIQKRHASVKVIYLTGTIQYATEIFQTDPTYFLTKPIDENKLMEAIEKAIAGIESDRSDSILIRTNGSELLICKKKIIYVESRGRKLVVHLNDGSETTVYAKMDVVQEQLGAGFVRSHKSFLINMKYIVERNNTAFCLSNGMVLPISKSNLKKAKTAFAAYLGDYS